MSYPRASDLDHVKSGNYRLIHSSKRKRKLDMRGEDIWWSEALNGWLWKPDIDWYGNMARFNISQ